MANNILQAADVSHEPMQPYMGCIYVWLTLHEQEEKTMRCYIFDIDGTLADLSHRVHHIKKQPKDWDSFFAATKDDKPFIHMRGVVHSLWFHGYIVFVSGRPERTRGVTKEWLRRHGFWHAVSEPPLYMRPDNDRRDDDIIKREILAQVRSDGYEPIMAFDDRDRVVRMWREMGIPCAQVAEGNF